MNIENVSVYMTLRYSVTIVTADGPLTFTAAMRGPTEALQYALTQLAHQEPHADVRGFHIIATWDSK
jgi:hypothetical protein